MNAREVGGKSSQELKMIQTSQYQSTDTNYRPLTAWVSLVNDSSFSCESGHYLSFTHISQLWVTQQTLTSYDLTLISSNVSRFEGGIVSKELLFNNSRHCRHKRRRHWRRRDDLLFVSPFSGIFNGKGMTMRNARQQGVQCVSSRFVLKVRGHDKDKNSHSRRKQIKLNKSFKKREAPAN